MRKSETTVEPPDALARRQDAGHLIAVAMTSLTGNSTLFAHRIFYAAFEAALSQANLPHENSTGMFGAEFVLFKTEVQDRNAGLRLLLKTVEHMRIGVFCEVAAWDEAEGYWRTVQPMPAKPFDRFFAPEAIAAAEEAIRRDNEILGAIERRINENSRRPNEP